MLCFLYGMDWIINYYLGKLQLQKVNPLSKCKGYFCDNDIGYISVGQTDRGDLMATYNNFVPCDLVAFSSPVVT
jgi:hypothetical protein